MLKERIDQDLKQALLSGDKTLATTLRGIKSVILYAEVASGEREKGLGDQSIIVLLQKELKKRQESADLFRKGGNEEKALAEEAEKQVIQKYLPEQMSEADIAKLIDNEIEKLGEVTPQQMGQLIGKVKQASNGQADGALIAKLVKERLAA